MSRISERSPPKSWARKCPTGMKVLVEMCRWTQKDCAGTCSGAYCECCCRRKSNRPLRRRRPNQYRNRKSLGTQFTLAYTSTHTGWATKGAAGKCWPDADASIAIVLQYVGRRRRSPPMSRNLGKCGIEIAGPAMRYWGAAAGARNEADSDRDNESRPCRQQKETITGDVAPSCAGL